MGKKYTVLLTVLIFSLFTGIAVAAPVIDADLTDWGLGKLTTDPWGSVDTWLPNDPIDFVVEDNRDADLTEGDLYFTGVHIQGRGSSYGIYHEQKVLTTPGGEWVTEPYGGEHFDLEAMYLDQDPANAYVAIVTSVNPDEGGGLQPGDLALNVDGDMTTGEKGYEYGIVLGASPQPGFIQGDIVYLPDWDAQGAIAANAPDVMVGYLPGGYTVGNLGTNLRYNNAWMTIEDYSVPNYVIEAAIPKASIGATGKYLGLKNLFYADNCLNDTLYVPEFPTIAISIGAILGMIFLALNSKNKN